MKSILFQIQYLRIRHPAKPAHIYNACLYFGKFVRDPIIRVYLTTQFLKA